jgi:hypothetical protein
MRFLLLWPSLLLLSSTCLPLPLPLYSFVVSSPLDGADSIALTNNSEPPKDEAWQQFFTDDGHPYFYNAATGESRWA